MDRREAIQLLAAVAGGAAGIAPSAADAAEGRQGRSGQAPRDRLPYNAGQRIPVAFVVAPGAELVDFAGPWGVFEYAYLGKENINPFDLFTVAENSEPRKVSGGMTIVPDYSFANAPQPKVIVVPALLDDPSDELLDWIRKAAKHSDLTMSVCNGAFVLAKAGLLSGKSATSHHGAYALFQADFPDVKVIRGARFVDQGSVATSGGLMSGIDLALHVVARYLGDDVAKSTATALEYQGSGWQDANSNREFARRPISTESRPICPVCELEVDKARSFRVAFGGRNFYLCSDGDKRRFEQTPERFVGL